MVGAGYSAVDQAVIMAQITQQNFLGYGQILSLKASLGSTTNDIDLSFTEPWLFDLPIWSQVSIWKYKKDYDDYTLDSRGAGLTLGYPLWKKLSDTSVINLLTMIFLMFQLLLLFKFYSKKAE